MMFRQCKICKKKVPFNEKCECEIKENKNNHNEWFNNYYETNKEELKKINNAKWKKTRKMIINRDGGYCQRCFIKFNVFITDNLQVHHIKPRSSFPELVYTPSNLVTICKRCNLELGTQTELDFEFKPRSNDYHIR